MNNTAINEHVLYYLDSFTKCIISETVFIFSNIVDTCLRLLLSLLLYIYFIVHMCSI